MLPLVFVVGLLFGLKRWPAVLVFVVGWPLIVLLLVADPPSDFPVYCLVVLANAAVGVVVHEIAAAGRRLIHAVIRRIGPCRKVSPRAVP